ncbi:glycosyltransferase family 9 protein [Acidisoma cellulosilytica]|uniref:Glycosyltransferase family 9 protein n=1 Tax=Acidisoma cellulosilyticum TaxID=2802395 RepID=A0A963YYU5_9PROT|nr:glycosyltransferase family 9 protein [Acidisoma cellulosilyticum]MCB8879386.1 glycosyltransferase family 9 protein [Acidisoma cellulosilyticum]
MARPKDPRTAKRILVIRLSALGDVILSFGPFAAIRAQHPDAHITLLTTPAFARLGRLSPWFDDVVIDRRAPWWDLRGFFDIRRKLRGYDFVYDLQTSGRSSRYFALAGRPGWSGIAQGASHPHANPERDTMHTWERQRDQLAMAGIASVPMAATDWLIQAANPPEMPERYALLVPGAAPHRPAKRWPTPFYGQLGSILVRVGITPVVIGTGPEGPLARTIQEFCPEAIDLTGQTDLPGLAALAAGARFAVGNDTGPMHLAAAMGCPTVTLFSYDSDPSRTQPRGPTGQAGIVLREDNLVDLALDDVTAALSTADLL